MIELHDKWFFICNPIANGGKMKKDWPALEATLKKEQIAYDWAFTTHNNHAIRMTMEKIEEGYRRFAVVGGDGSINEVVNGMFSQNQVPAEELLLALIPLGTANDWARTHKIPKKIHEAVRRLKTGSIKKQDVGLASYHLDGKIKTRYFNNVAGMAYDAYVANYLEKVGGHTFSQWKYIYYVLYCLFKFKLPKAQISYDSKSFNEKVYTINVGICKYNGGGLRLVPQAIPDDGLFALTIAAELSKFKVIRNMYRFYTGSIGELKEVITTQAREIEVQQSGEEEIMLELDGEFMGFAPIKFTLLPSALRFIG